jgi:hypothetical protein
MIVQPKVWYLEERAEALALVHLTRRNDLRVTKLNDDYGVDLLVEISRDDLPTGRMFGVILRARLSPRELSKFDQINTRFTQDVPFPLCLFAFVMENDAAYYRWIKQPLVSREGFHSLAFNHSEQLNPLTKESMDQIVHEVEQWYNAKAIQAN